MDKGKLTTDGCFLWYCPGCEGYHGVPIEGGRAWGWNKSLTSPILNPSVLVYGHPTSPPFKPQPRCHCFVRDGKIQFLTDSEHKLAGQTVEMQEET